MSDDLSKEFMRLARFLDPSAPARAEARENLATANLVARYVKEIIAEMEDFATGVHSQSSEGVAMQIEYGEDKPVPFMMLHVKVGRGSVGFTFEAIGAKPVVVPYHELISTPISELNKSFVENAFREILRQIYV